jgi:hypothetical protein
LKLQDRFSRLFCKFAHSREFDGAVLGEEADDILLCVSVTTNSETFGVVLFIPNAFMTLH